MTLQGYLNAHFYTRPQLLELTGLTEAELLGFQARAVMPACSYRLRLNIGCDSVFGPHSESQEIEYYAKGYGPWLTMLQSMLQTTQQGLDADAEVYALFRRRYLTAMETLTAPEGYGLTPISAADRDAHIQREWGHFLAGTYGLCTRSGLPEEIAAKELAILTIKAITCLDELSHDELRKLTKAVELLDEVSAAFAPHEKSRSSRHLWVDEVRRRYRLVA